MSNNYNIVFIPISAYSGMAGTKRLNNIIYYLPKENFKIHNFELSGGSLGKLLSSFKLIYFLFRIKTKDKINILYHYSNINSHTLIPCVISKLLGYKIIIDLTEDYSLLKKSELRAKGKLRIFVILLLESTYRITANAFVVISKHLEKKASHFGKKTIAHIPISFNPSDFQYKQQIKTTNQNNKFQIFYGGSFGDKDGLEFLLLAFDEFVKTAPEAILITTGKINKNYAQKYQSYKDKMQFKNKVHDLGFVSEKKYQDLIENSDVLCMTRKSSEYANAGFPFKLAAFLATGNPVIATEISNIKDYLTNDSCFLIKPSSVDSIYNALCAIRKDKNLSKEIGKKGRSVAYKNFNAQQHIKKFIELIEKI